MSGNAVVTDGLERDADVSTHVADANKQEDLMGRGLLFRILWAVALCIASGATVMVADTWYHGAGGPQNNDPMYALAGGKEDGPSIETQGDAKSLSAAANISPADGAPDVPRDVTLNWPPGRYPSIYDVYFGAPVTDVNNATRMDTTGLLASKGQLDTAFDPPGSLAYGQTYYWRIDEVNQSTDGAVHKGPVWSFTVEPYSYPVKPVSAIASSAQPGMGPEKTIDGSGLDKGDQHGTEPTTMWLSTGTQPNWIQYQFDRVYKFYDLKVWNSNQLGEAVLGFGARKVTMEYSDGITWKTLDNVLEFARAPGAVGYVADTTIGLGGILAKHIRLTIHSTWAGASAVVGLSEVRFSHIPVQAFAPQPANEVWNVDVETDLNWRPGREAGTHRVFVGTDRAAVAGGTVQPQTVTEPHYIPANLDVLKTYYWRVDEVNSVTYVGDVWSFTTKEHVIVDDFESYNDTDRRISNTWIDGRTDGKSGSAVGCSTAADGEYDGLPLIYGGQRAMALEYNNVKPPYYSEVSRMFDTPQNWTGHGASILTLCYGGYEGADFVDKGNNAFTIGITFGEHDIGGTSDEFRFVYKRLRGDGSLTMRVDWIGGKAGPMIRETLDPGSRNAYCVVTWNDEVSFQWRQILDGSTSHSQRAKVEVPYWVRIMRTGNVFKAERSADGKTWTQQGTDVILEMTADVYIGMAVSNDNAWINATAEISNVSTTGVVTGSWQRLTTGTWPWTDELAARRANDPAGLYVTVEDAAGKRATVFTYNPSATTTGQWIGFTVSLGNLASAGVDVSAVKKLTIGVRNKAGPKPGGTGLIYIDDIGVGRPRPATRS